jgi:hypothetical protein
VTSMELSSSPPLEVKVLDGQGANG